MNLIKFSFIITSLLLVPVLHIISVEATSDDDFDEATEPPPPPVNLTCGGLISMPPGGSSLDFRYKSAEEYDNNENCLWTLDDNELLGQKRFMLVGITLVSNGFEACCDGLSILTWNPPNEELVSNIVTSSSEQEVGYYNRQFLSFTSDSSTVGTGFVVRIRMIRCDSRYNYFPGENWAFVKVPAGHTFGPAKGGERMTLIINPPVNVSYHFGVDYLAIGNSSEDHCGKNDLKELLVYEIHQLGNYALKSRLCKSQGTMTAALKTKFPLLVLFATVTTGGGEFRVTWNSTTTTIAEKSKTQDLIHSKQTLSGAERRIYFINRQGSKKHRVFISKSRHHRDRRYNIGFATSARATKTRRVANKGRILLARGYRASIRYRT